jgi:hypothetical protein
MEATDGDVDGSSLVDTEDLVLVLEYWGSCD